MNKGLLSPDMRKRQKKIKKNNTGETELSMFIASVSHALKCTLCTSHIPKIKLLIQ